MANLVIFGASDAARLAHYYFTRDSENDITAFTVDPEYCKADSFLGLPLVNFEEITDLYPPENNKMFIAIGYTKMNRVRADKYYKAKELGYDLVSYVSSRCSFLSDEPLGDNCLIMEGNCIQPFVKIGNNIILWSGSFIGHDSTIEDHCFIASHVALCGHCGVGEYSFIGANAVIREYLTIAPETLIGAGSVVMEDTKRKGVYVPMQAEFLKKNSDEVKL